MKYLSLLLFLSILSNCSFRKVLLNNADWLSCYQLDSYFDLNDKREEEFCKKLSNHIDFMKKKSIPDIVALIDIAVKDLEHPITYSTWKERTSAFIKIRDDLTAELANDIIVFFEEISEEEKEHFVKKMKEGNEEIEELAEASKDDYADDYEEWVEDRIDRIEDLLGNLKSEQKDIFFKNLTFSQAYWKKRVVFQERGLQNFLKIMRGADTKEFRKRYILGEYKAKRSKEHIEHWQIWRDNWDGFYKNLIASLTSKQRTHLKEELLGWREDLAEFANLKERK